MNAVGAPALRPPVWARPTEDAELYLPHWEPTDEFVPAEIPLALVCPWCQGAGACDHCYGSGFLVGGFVCPWCGGAGKCHRCGGVGTIEELRARGAGRPTWRPT